MFANRFRFSCFVAVLLIGASSALSSEPLPSGVRLRLGTSRLQHGSTISAIAFLPDERTLATLGYDERVCLWDRATGRFRRILPERGNKSEAFYVKAMSPDGTTLLVQNIESNVYSIIETLTGKHRATLKGSEEELDVFDSLAFSSDGKHLAATIGPYQKQKLCVWDTTTDTPLRTIVEGKGFSAKTTGLSADGKLLATLESEKSVGLWDVASGKQLRRLPPHELPIEELVLSPDGKLLATTNRDYDIKAGEYQFSIHICETTTGKTLCTWQPGNSYYHPLFAPDGKSLATVGPWGVVQLWDVRTGKPGMSFPGHFKHVETLAFASDGKTLAAADGAAVRLWDVTTGKERLPSTGHHQPIGFLAVSPDGRTLVSAGAEVFVWDLTTGRKKFELPADKKDGSVVAISPDGKLLATTDDKEIRLHSLATGKELARLKGHKDLVCSVVFSPDGRLLASGGNDAIARLWDVQARKEIKQFSTESGADIKAVAFSPNGKTLAVESGSVEYHPAIHLWDIASGKVLREIASFSQGNLIFSNDGKQILTGGEAFGWWMVSGYELANRQGWLIGPTSRKDQSVLTSLALSSDGKLLAGGFPDGVRVWRMSDQKEMLRLAGHRGPVMRVAFTPDGKSLVTAGVDTTVLVWNLADLMKDARPKARLTPEIAQSNWDDLASEDSTVEEWAVTGLGNGGEETVAWLSGKLKPATDADAPSAEEQKRITAALDVLELLRNPSARQLLERLAKGEPGAWLTREAGEALQRHDKPEKD